MKLTLAILTALTLTACSPYQIVSTQDSVTEIEKDMQDYACREHRGVKKYTKADNVPCNSRDIWMEW